MSASAIVSSRRWQFSLGTLLAMMGWVAVMCIALKTPTQVWAGTLFLLAFAGLMASLVGILLLAGRRRAFAIGYFAFGFAYAACLFVTESRVAVATGVAAGTMPTTHVAIWAFQQLHKDSVQTMTAPMGGMGGMGGYGGGMGGMGGGFNPGGGGGGGFFSVDSSETAVAGDDAAAGGEGGDPEEGAGAADGSGSDADDAAQASDPMGSGSSEEMGSGGMPVGDSGMGSAMGGDMSGMGPGMAGMSTMPGAPGSFGGPPPVATYTVAIYSQDNFVTIVHCLLAMLLGIVGGFIGQLFYTPSREASHESPAAATVAT